MGNQLKATYKAVVELKNASGFTYSDRNGAGITTVIEEPWKWFIKVLVTLGPGRYRRRLD